MFSSIKSQSRYKRRFHVSISFNPRPYTMRYIDGTKRAASRTLASTHTYVYRVENAFNAYVNYEHTLSRAIHHICKVSLLQEKYQLAVTYRNWRHFLCSTYNANLNQDNVMSTVIHGYDVLPFHRIKHQLIQTWIRVVSSKSLLIRGVTATCSGIRR
jgi:hypothetical protein